MLCKVTHSVGHILSNTKYEIYVCTTVDQEIFVC